MTALSIIVQNVSLRLGGSTLLDNISLEIPSGGHLRISGPSGSGKTILTKAIAGQLFHEGKIIFKTGNEPVTPLVLRVEQHYHFTNRAHVQQFYYQQRFNSMDADDAATVKEELQQLNTDSTRLDELLDIFGMSNHLDAPLLHLSSGEHKRFQLIKAFLQSPQLLILDEPFTGMDTRSRSLLRNLITECAYQGMQFIIICEETDCPALISNAIHLDHGQLTAIPVHQEEENIQLPDELPALADFHTTIISMKQARIAYGENVLLENINWEVQNGERWWLKGVNGSGKSTLLGFVTGDHPKAYASDLFLFGKKRGSGESIWDIKSNIGYVSPELQWYFDNSMTTYQAVASGLFDTIGLFRQLDASQHSIVTAWLEKFRLQDLQYKLLSLLSTSQQRLALLARAMVKNPHLLILDEPCQGLDDSQRISFTRLVDKLCEDPNRTLIYVTHYEEELPGCINKKIELMNGTAVTENYYSENLIPA
jgi:molybdate transport system ATP-binding protein